MIKFNRIGNKLGLAGVVGVLLAMGLVANQLATESTVAAANDRTDRLQQVSESTLAAHLNMRQVQLAARGIRLARTPSEIDTAVAEMRQFGAIEAREIDVALSTAQKAETRDRLQKIKSLMASYSAGIEELAKAQRDLLTQIDKRSEISVEWAKAIAAQLASPALAKLDNRVEIEKLLLQADIKVNALQAMVWRLGATGDASLIASIAKTQTALRNNFNELRGEADDRDLLSVISALDKIVKRFLAANDEAVKIEELKADIVTNRTANVVNEAGELMEVAVSNAQKSMTASKQEVAAAIAQANRINMAVAIVVVISLIASVIFSFLGVARPMTRLNGALGQMAAGNLDIVIPGADRGDEIGDLAKTVTVIRENAEQKARDEAEAKITQDQVAARQRKADMIKLADDFEGAVGEIVETVSSASTELEASAGTLTATAERAQELTIMVAAASEEASTNVQSVASATEEMASSVNEISRQVQESARMANEAVGQARKHQRSCQRAVEGGKPHRRCRRTDQYHRGPDQSAGAECDHRGRARRRRRPRFRGGGFRGEGAGRADREGDRRNRPADHRHPGGDPGVGQRHQGNQRHHRKTVRDLLDHRGRGGRAGRGDAGDFPQRAAGGAWHPAGLVQHHGRAARRRRDRLGLLAGALRGAVAVRRQQPPQARGRQVPELGQGGIAPTLLARPGSSYSNFKQPAGHASAFSRRDAPEVCVSFTLLEKRGRRESRAPIAPAVVRIMSARVDHR